jgi:hypothetical protein
VPNIKNANVRVNKFLKKFIELPVCCGRIFKVVGIVYEWVYIHIDFIGPLWYANCANARVIGPKTSIWFYCNSRGIGRVELSHIHTPIDFMQFTSFLAREVVAKRAFGCAEATHDLPLNLAKRHLISIFKRYKNRLVLHSFRTHQKWVKVAQTIRIQRGTYSVEAHIAVTRQYRAPFPHPLIAPATLTGHIVAPTRQNATGAFVKPYATPTLAIQYLIERMPWLSH